MTAFVNGAISALNRCLNLINILDPEGLDENLTQMRMQINIYIQMYKELDNVKKVNIDETWNKIKKASDLTDAQIEEFEKIIFDA